MKVFADFWSRSPLVIKYSAIVSGLITSCVVLLGAFYFGQFRELVTVADEQARAIVQISLEDSERGRGYGLAAASQRIFAEPLSNGDMKTLRIGVEGLAERQEVGVLRITDAYGHTVLETGNDVNSDLSSALKPTDTLQIVIQDNILIGTGPIMSGETRVGGFVFTRYMKEATMAFSQVDQAFALALVDNQKRILIAITLAGCLAIMCGSFLATRIARRLSRPIQQLVEASGQISQENFGHKLPVEHKDEIGDLFVAFNEMSYTLARGHEARLQAQQSEIARLEAEQASQAKTEFLANMSHEIRTPMNGVMGMAQLLSMSALNPAQKQQVDVIMRSGEALLTVINDILDFSKIQSGQLRLNEASYNVRAMVEDIMALMGHTAREKGVELIGDMPLSIPENVVGDEGRIRQILLNLVGNAIKFTSDGYVCLRVRHVDADVSGTLSLQFDVEDTGIGIAQDSLDRIFNQFEQADNTTTRRFGGTGLGLSISQQLAEIMGGDISVRSELGQGSVFTFKLRTSLSEDGGRSESEPTVTLPQKTPILVVDDLLLSRTILSQQLKRFGAVPVCVPDAKAALQVMNHAFKAHGFRFPMVVCDHDMPGMSGLDLVKEIRRCPDLSRTHFVMLTQQSASHLAEDYEALRVHEIIEKPFPTRRLTEVLFTHLSNVQLDDLKEMIAASKSVAPKTSLTRPQSNIFVPSQLDQTVASDAIKILAADDNKINRMVLKSMLEDPVYDVTLVEDGQKAVEAYKAGAFDIILMDASMPVMNGTEAMKNIRAYEQTSGLEECPVIVVTAHVLPEERQRFLAEGMSDYLSKPLSKTVLRDMISKWTDARKDQAA